MADADTARQCSLCGEIKPGSEFYVHDKGASSTRRNRYCKDCDRKRPRNRTEARIIRTRARNRATAELIKAHKDEFTNLLNQHTDHATYEAMLIREADRSSHGEIPTLIPGQRRREQSVLDRIRDTFAEVGKCTDCSGHHKHGHVCANCGAAPGERAPAFPERRGTCSCPHAARQHDPEYGCLIGDCECSGHPERVT